MKDILDSLKNIDNKIAIPFIIFGIHMIVRIIYNISQMNLLCGEEKKYSFCDYSFFSGKAYPESNIVWFMDTIFPLLLLIIVLYLNYSE
jgi:hypothetical protein